MLKHQANPYDKNYYDQDAFALANVDAADAVHPREVEKNFAMKRNLGQCAAAALIVLLIGANCRAQEDKSLVLSLAFDEGTGTVAADKSGNGNNGPLKGAQWVQLAKGCALNFDGTASLVEVRNSPSLCMGDSTFTVEMWVKPADLSKSQVFISKGISQEFMIAAGGDYGPRACMFLTEWEMYRYSLNIFKPGEWVHLAFVKSQKPEGGAELTCYANGEESMGGKSKAFPATVKPTEFNLLIGGISDKWFFNGTLKDVKIYKRALTAEEIKASYDKVSRSDLELKPAAK